MKWVTGIFSLLFFIFFFTVAFADGEWIDSSPDDFAHNLDMIGESFVAREYGAVDDLLLQQLTSSNLLRDGTFLLTGRTDDVGICFLVDQCCNLIHQYRIDTPSSNRGAVVRGATRIGENIIAAVDDYVTGTSFIVVISSDGKITTTEKLSGPINAIEVLEDGLLVSGSYFIKNKTEVPWAAKVGKDGTYEWEFEGTPMILERAGMRRYFEFCAEYADEYVLLQYEALPYPDHITEYSMIRLAKDGSLVFSSPINLPEMKFGCNFKKVMIDKDMLVLCGAIGDSNFQRVATVAAINKSAQVLWIKEYNESVGVDAVEKLNDLYYLSLAIRDARGITMLVVDQAGNTIETFTNLFDQFSTDVIVKDIISDENNCLWIIGMIENATRCFIAELVGQ